MRSSGDPRQSWRSSVTPLTLSAAPIRSAVGRGLARTSIRLKYPLNLYRFLNLDCPNLIGGFQILFTVESRKKTIIFPKANQIAGVPAWSCEHRRCFTILLQTLLTCSSNLSSLIPQIVFISIVFFSNLGPFVFKYSLCVIEAMRQPGDN